jgi:hypothetical protein
MISMYLFKTSAVFCFLVDNLASRKYNSMHKKTSRFLFFHRTSHLVSETNFSIKTFWVFHLTQKEAVLWQRCRKCDNAFLFPTTYQNSPSIYSKLQPYFVSLLITSHPGNTILCTKRHQDDKDAQIYQLSTELKSVGQLQARGVSCMVFNATFNNSSVMGWGSVQWW